MGLVSVLTETKKVVSLDHYPLSQHRTMYARTTGEAMVFDVKRSQNEANKGIIIYFFSFFSILTRGSGSSDCVVDFYFLLVSGGIPYQLISLLICIINACY